MNNSSTDLSDKVEEIRLAIDNASNTNAPEPRQQQAKRQLLNTLPELAPFWHVYKDTYFPISLFRATKAQSIPAGKEHLINSFSYPMPDQCDLGRANLAGFPVLYLSDNRETALNEVKCKPEDVVYLSEWIFGNPKGAKFGIMLHQSLDEGYPLLTLQARHMLANTANQPSSEQVRSADHLQEIFKLYCQAFRSDDYTVSSLMAHHLLYEQDDKLDLLAYPSQAHDSKHCNLAVSPAFADQHMQLLRVFKLQCGENATQHTNVLSVGEISGGMVDWRARV